MAAAWVFLRAELRRRWRAWLSVALVAGAFAGVVTAAAAGARRTDSAYPRLLAWSKAPDIVIVSGYSADFAPLPRAALARLPQVTAMGYVQGIDLVAPTDITLLAPEDNRIPGGFWKRKIVAGRLADPRRPNEVNVSFTLAAARPPRRRPQRPPPSRHPAGSRHPSSAVRCRDNHRPGTGCSRRGGPRRIRRSSAPNPRAQKRIAPTAAPGA